EELQQVAQLLGALAQVMQGFWGRVRGDRAALRGDPPVRLAGSGAGQHSRGGTPPPRAVYVADLEQRLAPVVGDGAEPRPAQRRGQPPELAGAPPDEEGAQRLQIVRGRGDQLFGQRVEAEQVDVQVPDRRGRVAEPLELDLEV